MSSPSCVAITPTVPSTSSAATRDLFQLVDDARGVRVVYTAKGMNNLQYATDDWLLDRYGVTGGAYADLALLRR
ncbi:MAG: hypothetical protein U0R64_10465 [Candidatus Nanopelagicales bacterium]